MELSNDQILTRIKEHVNETYPDQENDLAGTSMHIEEALNILRPFQPFQADLKAINRFLMERRATRLACLAAWGLYRDCMECS